jgi:hypothetical protein
VDLFVAAGGSADVSRRAIVDTFFDNGTMTDRGSRAVQAIARTTPEQHVKFVGIALSDRTLDDEDVRALYTAAGLAKLETRGLDRLTSNGSASDLAISYADRLATYRMEHRVADNDTVTPWVQISERRLVRTHTDDGEIQLSELDAIRDGDNDGVLTFRERKAGTLPSVPDSDGDGLDDYDEIYGIPALGIGEGVLHPTQNDIVVEVDRAGLCTRLTSYEERQMKRAFRGGPSSPIFLHFAYDDYRLPKSESDTIGVEGADEFTNASQTFATVYDYVNRYEDRNPATHYALLTDANAISSEAVVGFHPTDPPDNNWFVVECNNLDIDRSGDQDEIEGVPFGRGPSFMHELGHSLGLPHPGTESNSADDMPPFDQHRSIMNYNAPETFYNFTDAEWEAISATLDRDES